MSLKKRLHQAAKKILFGGPPLPNRFFIAQTEPQQEITVWLHGAGAPIDVTRRHCEACGSPFILCIGFPRNQAPTETQRNNLSLRFCETSRENTTNLRPLGEINLQYVQTLESGDSEFLLFRPSGATNYCLSKSRLFIYTLWHAFNARRRGAIIRVSAVEQRAMEVMFICPRPVSLISVTDDRGDNIYPLNVMGDLSENFFALCFKTGRLPAQCVEKTGRLVLSGVPMTEAPNAYKLGRNHNVPTIDITALPFATRPSVTFGTPVPSFACRVREMEIDQIHKLGYHTFFLARVVSDEQPAQVPELCVIHGFYENWRVKHRGINKQHADAEDAYVSSRLSTESTARHPTR